ncbi:MAG TPA: pentapeptide repeat-containing protein [Treponemataceae bacterium]|nr:pentapeptide repeat-containing protein [Treponemataceae bacterium]HPS42891.1 pentapeptide repeat-containing protein [Treponemataceae bacterium]
MIPELPFEPVGESDARAKLMGELASDDYHAGLRFEGVDFSGLALADHTFEDCAFLSCRFKELSLARVGFISCAFENCELVLVKLENATLNTVDFRKSKLVGVNFSDCNKFGFLPAFDDCLLESAVFFANCLKKARFIKSSIRNSDFIEADLRDACFDGSSLEGTTFQKCNLERADFREAFDYSIDPANNRLVHARFKLPEAQSFLGFLGIELD